MPVINVQGSLGDMLNLVNPQTGETIQVPVQSIFEKAPPIMSEDWDKNSVWTQKLTQLKDVPFPTIDKAGRALVYTPGKDNGQFQFDWVGVVNFSIASGAIPELEGFVAVPSIITPDGLGDANAQARALVARDNFLFDQLAKFSLMPSGEFNNWASGKSIVSAMGARVQVPIGCTIGTLPFAESINVFPGQQGVVIRRLLGSTATNPSAFAVTHSRKESKKFIGRPLRVKTEIDRSAKFSGTYHQLVVQYSEEPEQVIVNEDGTYTNWNRIHKVVDLQIGINDFDINIPASANQVAFIFKTNYVGTSEEFDQYNIKYIRPYEGALGVEVLPAPMSETKESAERTYWTTYPNGLPRGANTQQGSFNVTALSTAIQFAFAIDVRYPVMDRVPTFKFQSPTSGVESRILNVNTGTNINGLAHALGNSGVTISNNGAAVVGNRYLCHATADAHF